MGKNVRWPTFLQYFCHVHECDFCFNSKNWFDVSYLLYHIFAFFILIFFFSVQISSKHFLKCLANFVVKIDLAKSTFYKVQTKMFINYHFKVV